MGITKIEFLEDMLKVYSRKKNEETEQVEEIMYFDISQLPPLSEQTYDKSKMYNIFVNIRSQVITYIENDDGTHRGPYLNNIATIITP